MATSRITEVGMMGIGQQEEGSSVQWCDET